MSFSKNLFSLLCFKRLQANTSIFRNNGQPLDIYYKCAYNKCQRTYNKRDCKKEGLSFMWTLTATARTRAAAARVWAIYGDVANWPRWDYGMAFYRPDGPFAAGTAGTLQPVGGPELPFTITYVEERRRFDDRTPLGPDHAIIARHELTPLAEGTQITHIVEIEGPDAESLAQQMGFKQEELDETVANLARYAEGENHD
jgi:Polyketide cyclase / dehydrase and lipid transport